MLREYFLFPTIITFMWSRLISTERKLKKWKMKMMIKTRRKKSVYENETFDVHDVINSFAHALILEPQR